MMTEDKSFEEKFPEYNISKKSWVLMSDWINTPEDISKYQGFVYCITHKATGKYYIGKKFFWSKRTMPPLKGRRNKRHKVVESDWKDYWSSSPALKSLVEKEGADAFERRMLKWCETKFDCAYHEAEAQFDNLVLFDPLSFNEVINVRLRRAKKND